MIPKTPFSGPEVSLGRILGGPVIWALFGGGVPPPATHNAKSHKTLSNRRTTSRKLGRFPKKQRPCGDARMGAETIPLPQKSGPSAAVHPHESLTIGCMRLRGQGRVGHRPLPGNGSPPDRTFQCTRRHSWANVPQNALSSALWAMTPPFPRLSVPLCPECRRRHSEPSNGADLFRSVSTGLRKTPWSLRPLKSCSLSLMACMCCLSRWQCQTCHECPAGGLSLVRNQRCPMCHSVIAAAIATTTQQEQLASPV